MNSYPASLIFYPRTSSRRFRRLVQRCLNPGNCRRRFPCSDCDCALRPCDEQSPLRLYGLTLRWTAKTGPQHTGRFRPYQRLRRSSASCPPDFPKRKARCRELFDCAKPSNFPCRPRQRERGGAAHAQEHLATFEVSAVVVPRCRIDSSGDVSFGGGARPGTRDRWRCFRSGSSGLHSRHDLPCFGRQRTSI